MSAPLFANYCKNITKTGFHRAMRKKKRPIATQLLAMRKNARVFSFTERASHEAACLSCQPPDVLLNMLNSLPEQEEDLWIEYDPRAADRGLEAMGTKTQGGTVDPSMVPIRAAFVVPKLLTGGYRGLSYLSYPDHPYFMASHVSVVDKVPGTSVTAETVDSHIDTMRSVTGVYGLLAGMGFAYGLESVTEKQYQKMQAERELPPVLKDLAYRVVASPLLSEMTRTDYEEAVKGFNGCARTFLVLLSMALNAGAKSMPVTESVQRVPRAGGKTGNHNTYEVDIFLNRDSKPGHTAKRAVIAAERARHRLHGVSGHWAYRQARHHSGAASTPCGALEHVWEDVPSAGKKQVCMKCGQVRWWRSGHQRGDAALGTVPQKVHNVRLGSPKEKS